MTVVAAVRTLRERWLTLVVGVLVGAAVALVASVLVPPTFASTAKIYIAPVGMAANPPQTASAEFARRLKSYREVLVSERVVGPVAARLGLPSDLASRLTVTYVTGSGIVPVTATMDDPATAAVAADAVAERFVEVVAELERPPGSTAPPLVAATVVDGATAPSGSGLFRGGAGVEVGAVLGFLVAAAWALARAALDTRVRSRAALRAVVGGTAMGVLPLRQRRASESDLGDDAAVTEELRRIRAALLCAGDDGPPRVVVVASAMPAEGRTTLVCRLAEVLAAQRRVVVVDADLRRPDVADRLGVPDRPGLTDVLAGHASLDVAVQRAAPGGVEVLPAGTPAGDGAADVLSSLGVAGVLDKLRTRGDVVLVDTAALAPVADAAVLAHHADAVVVLARDGVTTADQLAAAVAELDAVRAPVIGSVLTMCPAATVDDYGSDRRAVRDAPGDGARDRTRHRDGREAVGPAAVPGEHAAEPVGGGRAHDGDRNGS